MKQNLVRVGNTGAPVVRRALTPAQFGDLAQISHRAILATLLYHGIRCEELCRLRLRDLQSRQGVMHFRVHGKRSKIRFIPIHAMAQRLIEEYVALLDLLQGKLAQFEKSPDASEDELDPHPSKLPINLAMERLNIRHGS